MKIQQAINMFDALSQETRLRAFRLLVKAGPDGLPAGVLSERLGTPHNTLSFHLNHLSNAGIVSSRKQGRSVIYSANFEATHQLIGFMVEDCCSTEFASIREDSTTGCSIIELANCCQTAVGSKS
uniref:ArsR/SmtB family transcription factor n=1 Tax=Aestuariirhabdus haliotis TaxID=2918751 RepID=UPI00201B3DD5|nr:metalloregulator ArsR/SmtB family transcription factor [Aestuariirhabdus haliotis]MCL6417673.1 metalloregulator ArsR/SmtB family transcription factor [Aestuariirhabdus haliotis]MCL6421600.1 metalloregulator ArsR/SmtB family transcription factor [Aestuariirhabdus haliotis]